jgi:preprotein translocase subunit Sss1
MGCPQNFEQKNGMCYGTDQYGDEEVFPADSTMQQDENCPVGFRTFILDGEAMCVKVDSNGNPDWSIRLPLKQANPFLDDNVLVDESGNAFTVTANKPTTSKWAKWLKIFLIVAVFGVMGYLIYRVYPKLKQRFLLQKRAKSIYKNRKS